MARYDLLMTALSGWFLFGLYLDGWAHNHRADIETFFTPWHAVFYAGFGAVLAGLVWGAVDGRRRGASGSAASPRGYGWSLVGAGIFAAGGLVDMAWHAVFGIEMSVEALFSPPHLVLATGMALVLSGPLRAAWARPGTKPTLPEIAPAILSAAFTLSILTFFTQLFHPFSRPWADAGNRPEVALIPLPRPDPVIPGMPGGISAIDLAEMTGIGGIILQTFLLMGLVVALASRWRLPAGSIALLLSTNAALLAFMRDQHFVFPVAVAGGLAADALLVAIRPEPARPARMWVFAAAVPVVLFSLYFAALAATSEVWWSPHALGGAVFLSGAAGLLAGLVGAPPRALDVVRE
ncbi:MAG: hypothetical protein ACT4PT_12525 [Methanobacteriota archaeon]